MQKMKVQQRDRERGEGEGEIWEESRMCLTAGAHVGVMGDPAGPRGNRQGVFFALALQDLAGVRCSGDVTTVVSFSFLFPFGWAHNREWTRGHGVPHPAAPHPAARPLTSSSPNLPVPIKKQAASSFSFYFPLAPLCPLLSAAPGSRY